jgi:hypothetical protein
MTLHICIGYLRLYKLTYRIITNRSNVQRQAALKIPLHVLHIQQEVIPWILREPAQWDALV